MSLKVSPELLVRAEADDVTDDDFVRCIRESLPYAWSVVEGLADRLEREGGQFADNQTTPPDQASWGQLFRLVGSDAMRGAVERHFGMRLAFQNCCRVALFRLSAHEEYAEFISPRAQLLNQRPELVDC